MSRRPAPRDASGPLVVTIDGPAGSGKSTVARRLAGDLGWGCLDSGALYRVLTLAAREAGVALEDVGSLVGLARKVEVDLTPEGRVIWGGRDVTERIRAPDVTEGVAALASLPQVRRILVERQRAVARRAGRLVAEGRDMGTVVFPDAAVKIWLDADPRERARRRMRQEDPEGTGGDRLAAVLAAIEERDRRDRSRATSPLVPAADAWRLDTTGMTLDEVVAAVASHVRSRIRSAAAGGGAP